MRLSRRPLRAKERQKADLSAKLEHLDGLQQASESFDPVAWMKEMSDLLGDLHKVFQVFEVLPGATEADRRRVGDLNRHTSESGRRILRVCLPRPLLVSPDPAGGWIYEGEGRFSAGDLRAQVRGIGRRIGGSDPDTLKLVPPG